MQIPHLKTIRLLAVQHELDMQPESYFFALNLIILFCALDYCVSYLLYTRRVRKYKELPGYTIALGFMIGYETYYAFQVTDIAWQRLGCLAWLACDLNLLRVLRRDIGAGVAPPLLLALLCICVFYSLGRWFPSEHELLTAYYSGWILQLPLGYFSAWWHQRYQKLGRIDWWIWLTRGPLGIASASGVFLWRYWHDAERWAFVAWRASIIIITATILGEVCCFVVLLRLSRGGHEKAA